MDRGFCISKIYDAVTSVSQWDETMDVIAQYTGAKGSAAISTDIHLGGDRHMLRLSQLWRNTTPDQMRHFNTTFKEYEQEAFSVIAQKNRLEILHDGDQWDLEELRQRPDMVYYRENFGTNRRLAAKLSDHPGWIETLTLQFDHQYNVVPDASRASMSNIVQHVAKVIELNRTFSLLEQRYQAVLMALDKVHIGICVAQRDGEIIIHNQEAHRILDARDGLSLSAAKRLAFNEREQSAELQLAIDLAAGTTRGEVEHVESLLYAERTSAMRAILIEVTPLTDGLTEIDLGFQGALIYIIDPENPAPLKVARLALACALSEAEAAVCERVAHGWKNADIAEDRNVSIDTIKTQIAHIFSKTGVSTRSELIRLILKSSPPIG